MFVMAGAAYGETVAVRGWSHPDFGRLVFDWPSRVGYSARIDGKRLTVRFDKPISARFEPALRNLGGYVTDGDIAADGRSAGFTLAGNFALRSFRSENSVVLDLRPKAESATVVGVRVGEHPNYTRLVFDWNSPVDYRAAMDGDRFRLRFNKPAQIDLASLVRDLPRGFGPPSATPGGNGLDFTMRVPGTPRLRHFRSGTKVVVDFLSAREESGPPRPEKQVTAPQAAPSAASPEPADNGAQSQSQLLEEARTAIEEAKRKAAETGPRRLLPEPVETPQKATDAEAEAQDSGTAAAAAASQGDVPETKPAETSQDDTAPPRKAGGIIAQAFREAKQEAAGRSSAPPLVSLEFEWPEPVAAAVFERAGFVWIVFDKRAPIDLAPLRAAGKGLVSNLEQLPIGNATVLRMVPAANVAPASRLDGTNWIVDFRRGRLQPEIQIGIDANADAEGGATLLFPTIETGDVIRIPDPEVGDLIQVATMRAAGHGIRGQRAYPEFQILASAQGLAVVGLNDEVELEKIENGLVLRAPDGLHISGVSPGTEIGRSGKVAQARRIFRLSQWRNGNSDDYYDARQELQFAVARQPRNQRNPARLRLAQFYFARGLAPESKGILQVIEGADARMATQPEFKALKGAVAALNNDFDTATQNLNDPRLDKYSEVHLWRGVAAARAEKWKDAQLHFKRGDSLLHGYPEPLKSKLGLLRIETALKARDKPGAARWLNELDKQSKEMKRGELATLRYLQGRLAFVDQNIDRATDLWTEAKESGDGWNGARAELSLINMGLLQGTMDEDEAIRRLEQLRFAWRGDEFEMQVLRRLGGLYLDRNDFRGGLGTYRVIATYFPKHPDTKRIAQIMTDTFKKLYLEGEADKLPPLTALALYDEFRELTPAGPDGNVMIQKLSERLVEVDLLNRAADLLEHQVKYRLQGVERAEVGAKLALIRLIDRNSKKALESLRMTVYPRLPEQLADDRRRIEARAMFETGQVEKAIELLAGDVSRNADLLRANIQWKSENWGEAAKVLQRLAGEPPQEGTTFDRTDAQVVLNWAVALRLDRDETGLEVVRSLYGPAMSGSPLSKAFQFISSPASPDEPLDLDTITNRIADTGVFEAFLAEYLADNKKRLLKSPVAPAPPREEPPQAAPPQASGAETGDSQA